MLNWLVVHHLGQLQAQFSCSDIEVKSVLSAYDAFRVSETKLSKERVQSLQRTLISCRKYASLIPKNIKWQQGCYWLFVLVLHCSALHHNETKDG